ncbi:MAG TPA: AMP-binding protein [Pseudonocardiaceae bacterium]|jgi:fatty-acyl-CoA synthase|nr:AMP-binding protein [Pseudonocardiaceae bacterium]
MTASDIDRARQQSIGDLLRRTALRYPDKTAVVYGDLCQTYVDLDDTVNRCANALAARGVAGGDRIALFSHNNHAFVVLYFALARLGAVSVPVNFMLSADEVRYVLDYSGATGLVTEDALLPVATRAAGDAVRVRAVIPAATRTSRTAGSPLWTGWRSPTPHRFPRRWPRTTSRS